MVKRSGIDIDVCPSEGVGVVVEELLEFLKLDVARIVLVDPLVDRFCHLGRHLQTQSFQHVARVEGTQVEVFIDVVLVEQFPNQQLVLAPLGLLNQFETQALRLFSDDVFLDGLLLFRGEVPLAADVPEENVVVGHVDVEVIVVGQKLLPGYFPLLQ